MDIFRSLKEWVSSAEEAEKNTKSQVQKEPMARGLDEGEPQVTKKSIHHAPKRRRDVQKEDSISGSDPIMEMGNRKTGVLTSVSDDGAFGFLQTSFGTVFLHKNDLQQNEQFINDEKYSFQLGEGNGGKLKAFKASIVKSDINPQENDESMHGEAIEGQKRIDTVKHVNSEKLFAILEGDAGTVMLHKNDTVDKKLPAVGAQYVYTLTIRDNGRLKALDASLHRPARLEDQEHEVEAINDLYDWAWIPLRSIGSVSTAIAQLADMALDEDWRYKDQYDLDVDKYGVLRSYIRFTFTRLSHEGKITEGEDYAVFNTGLVDRLYKPIYAFFEKNSDQHRQPWKWKSFCVAGQGHDGKLLNRVFSSLPLSARYFENIDDIYFDSDAPFSEDIDHIVLDGIRRNRYPHDFLNEYAGGFSFEEYQADADAYLSSLAKRINDDDALFRKLYNRLEAAIKLAQARARWNYRAVVPQYYPKHNKMSFLLPIALLEDTKIDAALVVQAERVDGELKYQGYTIFPLSFAYRNARLVAKPISDWLNPESILDS